MRLCDEPLQTGVYPFAWFPTADSHFARKSAASVYKTAISPQPLTIEMHFVLKGCRSAGKIGISPLFLDRNAFDARGSTQSHPNARKCSFTSVLTIETHLVWEGPYTLNRRNARIAISIHLLRMETLSPTLQISPLHCTPASCVKKGSMYLRLCTCT